MWFVLLSTLLTPICILASWEAVQTRVKEYMIAFLVLETLMVGMFCALDILVFYVFFEGVLIPMFLIIGVWGGPQIGRAHAELQSLMRISYAVSCLKKQNKITIYRLTT